MIINLDLWCFRYWIMYVDDWSCSSTVKSLNVQRTTPICTETNLSLMKYCFKVMLWSVYIVSFLLSGCTQLPFTYAHRITGLNRAYICLIMILHLKTFWRLIWIFIYLMNQVHVHAYMWQETKRNVPGLLWNLLNKLRRILTTPIKTVKHTGTWVNCKLSWPDLRLKRESRKVI